jgi:hypothetical protein
MAKGNRRDDLIKAVWDILVTERRTLSYGELAAKLARPGYRPIAQLMPQLLTPIMAYCDDHNLPRLNDLVVGQESQRPNYAPPGYDYKASQQRVLAFDWATAPVTADDFAR